MAGGKLSARQKMINLMYLIFISMLAMNMGKKVLSSFGRMNETFITSNQDATKANGSTLTNLATKAQNQPEKYGDRNQKAQQLSTLSTDFYNSLQTFKDEVMAIQLEGDENGSKASYEAQDGSAIVDQMFFFEGKQTEKGKDFVNTIEKYKTDALALLGDKFPNTEILDNIKKRFDTSPDKHGKKGKGEEAWLESRFEGFPLIATITNITKMQSDIKMTETEVYATLLGGQLESDVSMTNYDAMVVFSKNAYYPGEKLEGKIVLGKNDPTLKASKVIVNGRAVAASNIKAGQVILSGSAGNVGEHELKGKFYFQEGDKEIEIDIIGGKYSVIPMPNQAIISADKMNVVYQGVDNPISVSMPGVSANKIRVSAPGLSPSGKGYIMRPGKSRNVTISVNATLPNGKKVTSNKEFRVKPIPSPTGTVRGGAGYQKMSKSGLAKSTVGSVLKDFVFDLKMGVASFKVKVPGKPSITCRGTRFSDAAKRAIGRAKRGDVIVIFDIKSVLTGNSSYILNKTAGCSVEITS